MQPKPKAPYKNVLTASEVATAFAGGAAVWFVIGPGGMLIAAICLAFYEQRKRRRRAAQS